MDTGPFWQLAEEFRTAGLLSMARLIMFPKGSMQVYGIYMGLKGSPCQDDSPGVHVYTMKLHEAFGPAAAVQSLQSSGSGITS